MAVSLTARDIEIAVARHFNYRLNIIVPNVSWGLLPWGHEADMIIIRPSGYAEEIEIKISGSDIKADTKKRHREIRAKGLLLPPAFDILRRLWFAVPEKLKDHPDIPAYAGILAYQADEDAYVHIVTARAASINKNARRLTPDEHAKALHLGCMRIWSLKEALSNVKGGGGRGERLSLQGNHARPASP